MTDPFELRIEKLAREFSYPPSPRVEKQVMTSLRARHAPRLNAPRLAWGIAIFIALLAGLMTVPPVRAAVLEFIQIGIVRIFPRPTPASTGDVHMAPTALPGVQVPVTAMPGPTASSD